MGLTISKEQISALPKEVFEGKIIVVEHPEQVEDAVTFLNQHKELGFDTETKPAFKRGQSHKVALLQLSTENICYLFRLNKIGYPEELDEIVCNPKIKKIGLSLRDDFDALRERSQNEPSNFVDLQPFVDKYNIEDNSLQRIYAIIFKKRISKRQRLSNWESEKLTEAQKNYAALDAWACLKIYNYLLENESKHQ